MVSRTGIQSTHHFTVSPSEITIDRMMIERGLGYGKGTAPAVVSHLIEEILPLLPDHVEYRCGFTILPPESIRISDTSISGAGVTFDTGPIIAKRLRRAHTFALFAATVGPGLERWSGEFMAEGDAVKGFIVDAIASGATEQLAELLEVRIEAFVRPSGWKITNRYSPGHCGWSVAEQHKLFSFMPDQFCGISLTPSALMIPIKSVSGIVGLGEQVKREEYQCSLCDMKDCYRRQMESIDEGKEAQGG